MLGEVCREISYMYTSTTFKTSTLSLATQLLHVFQPAVWMSLLFALLIPFIILCIIGYRNNTSSPWEHSLSEYWHWLGVAFSEKTTDPQRHTTGARQISLVMAFSILFVLTMYENCLITALLMRQDPKIPRTLSGLIDYIEDNDVMGYAPEGSDIADLIANPGYDSIYQRLHQRFMDGKFKIELIDDAVTHLLTDESSNTIILATSTPMMNKYLSEHCKTRVHTLANTKNAFNSHLMYVRYHPIIDKMQHVIKSQVIDY